MGVNHEQKSHLGRWLGTVELLPVWGIDLAG